MQRHEQLFSMILTLNPSPPEPGTGRPLAPLPLGGRKGGVMEGCCGLHTALLRIEALIPWEGQELS